MGSSQRPVERATATLLVNACSVGSGLKSRFQQVDVGLVWYPDAIRGGRL
jgi:hypothetical protein